MNVSETTIYNEVVVSDGCTSTVSVLRRVREMVAWGIHFPSHPRTALGSAAATEVWPPLPLSIPYTHPPDEEHRGQEHWPWERSVNLNGTNKTEKKKKKKSNE